MYLVRAWLVWRTSHTSNAWLFEHSKSCCISRHACSKSMCDCILVSSFFLFPLKFYTCGGWKDEVWDNFTEKSNEEWNYHLFNQTLSTYNNFLKIQMYFCLRHGAIPVGKSLALATANEMRSRAIRDFILTKIEGNKM